MRKLVARGSFRSVGAQIGEETRSDLPFVFDKAVEFLLENATAGSLARMRSIADGYVASAKGIFPQAVEYLEGLAYGGGLSFEDVALISFSEEIRTEFHADPKPEKCTTLAVKTRDGWLIGHNEDYEPQYLGKMFALDLRISGHPRVLALNYPGMFPCLAGSLNLRGVAIANNSLWPDAVPGLSKNLLHFRAALAEDMDQAIEWLARQPAALTGHYTVAWAPSDDLVGLEVSNPQTAEEIVCLHQPGPTSYAHTNHVRLLKLKGDDPAVVQRNHSVDRLAAAQKILDGANPPRTPEAMLDLLSRNDGLLHRTPEQNPTSVTLATVVIRPRTGEVWIRDADPAAAEPDLHLSFGRAKPN